SVPEFEWYLLLVMAVGGIFGGVIGRILDKKMDEKMVNILFFILNVIIAGICVFNIVKYSL
ncbi:MAG: sulfite exporter TauE/SafE family protein, partial [Bacilli bacterium]|nr:sulfite exporter TauE/SafE family protein [Bacilli bacterium]MDY5745510.1 sulfite exporter TauE/SafE family protein [Bacilli bacterium]